MSNESQIKLGTRYEDSISGHKGTAIGIAEYLNGTTSVQVEGIDHNGSRRTDWIDAVRLVDIPDTDDDPRGLFLCRS